MPTDHAAKNGLIGFIEEFKSRIPPKQSAYLEYFHRLQEMIASGDNEPTQIAASFWLALIRPDLIEGVADTTWRFRLDVQLMGVLQKLLSLRLVAPGDTLEVARKTLANTPPIIESIDILLETLRFLGKEGKTLQISSALQLKLIQLLLNVSTGSNHKITNVQLCIILDKLAEIARYSEETVNQNAAKAAITQIVNDQFEGSDINAINQGDFSFF